MNRKHGFTLTETMIMVGLISLLGAIASVAVSKAHRNARIKQTETELNMLAAAVLQMTWDTGRWPNKAVRTTPGSTEIWNITGAAVGLLDTDGSYNNWKGPYYEGAVLDPWGQPYFFDPDYTTSQGIRIVIGSFGPNGKGPNLYDKDDIYILLDD
jgi:type II secretory pathway pseudopilin PulG